MKGTRFASRWKWLLLSFAALLALPPIQVATVRFINPPRTLPMLIEGQAATFSGKPKTPLLY
ncbi:MAG: hypothetical protein M3Y69_05850, partial [Verrucomicrobiota bacterium]|nr:hypothetical protein [Verrucomicrobiota bacterium]